LARLFHHELTREQLQTHATIRAHLHRATSHATIRRLVSSAEQGDDDPKIAEGTARFAKPQKMQCVSGLLLGMCYYPNPYQVAAKRQVLQHV
jgi:hypothetical protein